MIREAIKILIDGMSLTTEEMQKAMNDIMEGKATDAMIGSFLTALKLQGETTEEITGAAKAMREKSIKIKAPEGTVDTCGTGGDMAYTFNISTTSAIIVASAGIPVAKHGNRSVSSRSGSANVLDALGININLKPESVERCFNQTGFAFLFSPIFHPAMKYATGPRSEIGIRTIFNLLGPLTNPAGALRQVVGVYQAVLTEAIAEVLDNLGARHAFVVHSDDGLDEISIAERTRISELKDGRIDTYYITPEDMDIKRGSLDDIVGGDAQDNAAITLSILNGEQGAKRNIVLMNAAAAIVVGGKARDFKEGVKIASQAIDSGTAKKKLEEIKLVTNSLAE
jgi:anthranilate phosphoribosyltransferase